jgi:glucosylceramidase
MNLATPMIEILDHQTLPPIDGFGFALTWGSVRAHLSYGSHKTESAVERAFRHKRQQHRRQLSSNEYRSFGPERVRLFVRRPSPRETDPQLVKFSLQEDQKYVIPILKQILAINPKIKILGSPWSAPAWMKTTGNVKGGSLKPEYYGAYAKYFAKYVQGMKAQGIHTDAITVQNKPLNEKNTPSMTMSALEQTAFIKGHLGPTFKAAGINTKILLFDHNCNQPDYAMEILNDPQANPWADSSAFHLYEGKITAMSTVHDAFPDKNLYFTAYMAVEKMDKPTLMIGKHVSGTVIGAVRNWSRNVVLWNLAADSTFEPHTNNGGCPICQGAVTIESNEVTRNLAYYTIAHFSKLVRAGSHRLESAGRSA